MMFLNNISMLLLNNDDNIQSNYLNSTTNYNNEIIFKTTLNDYTNQSEIYNENTNINDNIAIPSLFYVISVSIILSTIDIATLIGNLLVVIAVLTTKSLSTVTNYFIMSLAVADMLVAVFVLPISIYTVTHAQKWIFGATVCNLWLISDVMLCTASILNLCCISLDRYFAITRPLQYSRQRSPKQARGMIAIVWIASIIISCPPLFGWRAKDEEYKDTGPCTLNRLLSYRIYSSIGSFFLPALVMLFVYARIFKVIHDREKYLMFASDVARKRLNSTSKQYENCIRLSRGISSDANIKSKHKDSLSSINSGVKKKFIPLNKSIFKSKFFIDANSNSSSNNNNNNNNKRKNLNEYYHKNYKNEMNTINEYDKQEDNTSINRNEIDSLANNNDESLTCCFKNSNTDNIKINNNKNNNSKNMSNNNKSENVVLLNYQNKNLNSKNHYDNRIDIKSSYENHKRQHPYENRLCIKPAYSSAPVLNTNSITICDKNLISKQHIINNKDEIQTLMRERDLTNSLNVTPIDNKTVKANDLTIETVASPLSNKNAINGDNIKSNTLNSQRNPIETRRNLSNDPNISNKSSLKKKIFRKLGKSESSNYPLFKLEMTRSYATSSCINQYCNDNDYQQVSQNSTTSTTNQTTNRYQEQIRLIKESKAAKTLAIVVGGFIICWLPFFVVYVLEPLCPPSVCYISITFVDCITWLGYCNSMMNPFIYAFYSKQFRSAFYRLTIGKCRGDNTTKNSFNANHTNHHNNHKRPKGYNYNNNNN